MPRCLETELETPPADLDRAFELVNALSTELEEHAQFVEEMELRVNLFVAEASGEVVTSAPPPWVRSNLAA